MTILRHLTSLLFAEICVLLLFLPFSAATQNLDSLWSVWGDASQNDTIRLQAMDDIVISTFRDDPDSALQMVDLILELAESEDLYQWQAIGLNLKGICFTSKSDYIKATEYHWKSLEISQELGFQSVIASSYKNLGNIDYYQGNFLEALKNYQKSLDIMEEAGDENLENVYNNIGGVYYRQGDYPKALEYFRKSMKINEKARNLDGMSDSYNNIGAIYFYQDDFTKALEYYQKSLALFEDLGNKWGMAANYNNIGEAYIFQGEYIRALDNIQKSLAIRKEIEDKIGMASSYSNLGKTYGRQSNFLKAQEHFQKSLDISQELGLKSQLATISVLKGELYIEMENYHQAIFWCNQGLQLAEESAILVEQKNACECLYNSHKMLTNDNKALQYHERFLTLSESLHLKETQKQLQQMEFAKQVEADSILNEKEKLETEIAYLEEVNKQKTRKNIFIFVGIGILLVAGGLWISRAIIKNEKNRSEKLLLNILPSQVAEELKEKGESMARNFDDVSVLFTDFKGFTDISERLNAQELVAEINVCFIAFDQIITSYGIEKIKTIGDAFMAAGGLHIPRTSTVNDVVKAGLDMQSFMKSRKAELQVKNKTFFEMRVGIHTGPIVAGIVGIKKFQYDIWGDTVNIANRMESSGEVGKVNVSKTTYNLIKDDPHFTFDSRGEIQAKNKDDMEMYFVELASHLISETQN